MKLMCELVCEIKRGVRREEEEGEVMWEEPGTDTCKQISCFIEVLKLSHLRG